VSSQPRDRAALLAGLNQELRWMSTYSVLFSHLVAARAGLTSTDLEALDVLALTGPIPVGRLARLTGLSSGAVTSLVDRLEAVGGARREPDPDDRRRVVVRRLPLPEPLAQIIGPAFTAVGRAMDDLFARYSDDDLALILDFATGANEVMAQRVAEAREAASTSKRGAAGQSVPHRFRS
jgi:DNA-binding MarR family transcriptional regulator